MVAIDAPVSGSHMQGGLMTFRPRGKNPDGTFVVDFKYKSAFIDRNDFETNWHCYANDCGQVVQNKVTLVESSPSPYPWYQTEGYIVRHLRSDKPFKLSENSCCWVNNRIGASGWNLLTSVDLGTRSDTSKPNISPVTTIIPVVRVPQNCPTSFKLMAHDPDGDTVQCRYGQPWTGECSSCYHHPQFNLNQNTCNLSLASSVTPGAYVFELILEDMPSQSISLRYSDGTVHYKHRANIRTRRNGYSHLHYFATDTLPTDTFTTDTSPTDAPYTETSPTDTPSAYTSPTDAPYTEIPPADTPSADTAPTDTSRTDTSSTDTLPTDDLPTDTSRTDILPTETSPTGTPSTDISPTGTPSTDISPTGTPSTDISPTGTPSTDISPTGTPSTDISPTGTPSTDISPTGTPSTDISPTDTPSTDISPTGTPSTDISPTGTPSTDISPTGTPSTDISPTGTPSTDISPTGTPSTDISPTGTPSTDISPTGTPSTDISPTGTPSTDISPTGTPSTDISPTGTPSTDISPTGTPSTDISPTGTPSTDISPTGTPSTDISPTGTPSTDISPTDTSPIASSPINTLHTDTSPTDFPNSNSLSSIPLQFIVEVTSPVSSCVYGVYRPKFLPPTPNQGEILIARAGTPFQLHLSAEASLSSITDFKVSGPAFMTKKFTSNSATIKNMIVEWTPSESDIGDHIPFCFVAQTVNGHHSELICVIVIVGSNRLVNSVLICNENTMTLIIKKTPGNELYDNHLRLTDPRCLVTSNSTHHIASVGYNSCGTEIQETENDIVFKNKITSFDNPDAVITRKHEVIVSFNCSFPKKNRVSAAFRQKKSIFEFREAGFGHFTYKFQFYRDAAFSAVYTDYPLKVWLRDLLYMEIDVTASVPNVELFVESCRATPHDNPNDPVFYDIIQNGCLRDDTLVTYPGNRTTARFGMEAFVFIGYFEEVYISCTVILCKLGDPNTRCAKGCIGKSLAEPNPHRRRRSSTSDASESLQHFISQGPLVLNKESNNKDREASHSLNVNTLVLSLSGVVVVALVAVTINLYVKKARLTKYERLPTEELGFGVTYGRRSHDFQTEGETSGWDTGVSAGVYVFELVLEDFPKSNIYLRYSDGTVNYKYRPYARKSREVPKNSRWSYVSTEAVTDTAEAYIPMGTFDTITEDTAEPSTGVNTDMMDITDTTRNNPTELSMSLETELSFATEEESHTFSVTDISESVALSHTTPYWNFPWFTDISADPETMSPSHEPLDLGLSKISLQFIVEVTSTVSSCTYGLYRPKFLAPTPNQGEILHAKAETPYQLHLSAEASQNSITDFKVSGPAFMTKRFTSNTTTKKSMIVEWTPRENDIGDHVPFCFVAETVSGYHSELRCIIVIVGPTNLVNSILICNENTMTLIIEKSPGNGLYQNHLRLNDPRCLVSSNSSHHIASVGYNSCGTVVQETEDNIVFKNQITSFDNTTDVITRKHQMLIPFNCSFPKENRVSAAFRAQKAVFEFAEAGFGNFTYKFQFYTDDTFTKVQTQYPLEVWLRDLLYLEIQVTASVPSIQLFVDSCRATPRDNPNDPVFYDIIQNGCLRDETLAIYPSTRTQSRFGMEAFAFIGSYEEVYIRCTVILCKLGDLNTRCAKGCVSKSLAEPNPHRRRRSSTSDASESLQHFISQGPVRMKRQSENNAPGTSPSMNVNTLVLSLSGVVIVALVAVTISLSMKKARLMKYTSLPTEEL
ncbi:LOW QUALITY PROTEIN: uncharacterized protein RCH25_052735 [Pelodytes ibericus]